LPRSLDDEVEEKTTMTTAALALSAEGKEVIAGLPTFRLASAIPVAAMSYDERDERGSWTQGGTRGAR
jgi:hypothetical protein